MSVEYLDPIGSRLSLDWPLEVGFGMVTVTRDSEIVWSGDEHLMTLEHFERKARNDPEHDWRVYFHAPLWAASYQRQGPSRWVLVETGEGFA